MALKIEIKVNSTYYIQNSSFIFLDMLNSVI